LNFTPKVSKLRTIKYVSENFMLDGFEIKGMDTEMNKKMDFYIRQIKKMDQNLFNLNTIIGSNTGNLAAFKLHLIWGGLSFVNAKITSLKEELKELRREVYHIVPDAKIF